MKFALVVALALAFASPALASRSLKQGLSIDFQVCSRPVTAACCTNYDFGEITPGFKGKPYPENTTCLVTAMSNAAVAVRPIDSPLEKEDVKAYVAETPVRRNVTLRTTTMWTLAKYDPPNNLWTTTSSLEITTYCLCATPGTPVPATGTGAAAAVGTATATGTAATTTTGTAATAGTAAGTTGTTAATTTGATTGTATGTAGTGTTDATGTTP